MRSCAIPFCAAPARPRVEVIAPLALCRAAGAGNDNTSPLSMQYPTHGATSIWEAGSGHCSGLEGLLFPLEDRSRQLHDEPHLFFEIQTGGIQRDGIFGSPERSHHPARIRLIPR